jgi:hypothetical protein
VNQGIEAHHRMKPGIEAHRRRGNSALAVCQRPQGRMLIRTASPVGRARPPGMPGKTSCDHRSRPLHLAPYGSRTPDLPGSLRSDPHPGVLTRGRSERAVLGTLTGLKVQQFCFANTLLRNTLVVVVSGARQ